MEIEDAELVVDFVSREAWPHPGKLGMTSAPGRRLAGGRRRELARDLSSFRTRHDASLVVCLLEPYEEVSLGLEALDVTARHADLDLVRLPIRDGQVPRDPDAVAEVVRAIADAAREGRTTIVHCRGGMGRTGTVVACCLVAEGRSPEDAIAEVRRARPGTVETGMQEAWIRSFARGR